VVLRRAEPTSVARAMALKAKIFFISFSILGV
jgi:hypothetical protein